MTKKNGKHNDFSFYKKEDADHLSLRMAKLLAAASHEKPGVFIAPNIAVREVMGYDHTPRIHSDEVDKMRTRYSAIRKILREKFKKDLLIETGVGVRATTGSSDLLVRSLTKSVKKLTTAKNEVVQVDGLIDMKDVPHTPELAPYRAMYTQQIKPLLKSLISPDFVASLKLPETAGKK